MKRSWVMLVGAFAPFVLQGQAPTRTPVRVRAASASSSANACRELASSPSPLVNAPEGLALLRLKRELESATLTLERNQQLQRDQVMVLSQVQRGVDSAMQVFVRQFGDGENTIIVRRNGDSTRVLVNGSPFVARTIEMRPFFMQMDSLVGNAGPQIAAFVRALQPQVQAFAEAAEAHLPSKVASPSGYLGLSLSGAQVRIVTPDGVLTSHCEYPMVESVDAGSPADRAGFSAGDTVLAYNGRDLTALSVNYPELLVPGSTVRVRTRRAGRTRELPVAVAPRADERQIVAFRAPAMAPRAEIVAEVRSGDGRINDGRFNDGRFNDGRFNDGRFPSRVMVSGGGSAPIPPAPPAPPVNAMLSGTGIAVLAGAQFATIDEEFASTLELRAGVLVLRVPPGTPAAEASLRAGDVVVSVNGRRVQDVATLRRMLSGNAREVRLGVQARNSSERSVVLRVR